jgi:hypothetical protein
VPASPRFVPNLCRKHEPILLKICSWSADWRAVLGQCAPSPRAGAMRAIAPGMPPHIFPQQGHRRPTPRVRAAGASGTKQAPTVQTCVSAGAPAAKLRPSTKYRRRYVAAKINCHSTDKAGYIHSSLLYIYRVVFILLRQRCGAGLSKQQRARGRRKYYRNRPHPGCFARRPKIER